MNELEQLQRTVGALLAHEVPTQEKITQLIDKFRPIFSSISDDEAKKLALSLESIHGVRMKLGSVLQTPTFAPWLPSLRSTIDFYYWDRYRNLLSDQFRSVSVLDSLNTVTDRTLGLLQNPNMEGSWIRQGMVMGHVQSGKTANYIGVLAKAADAGFRVIIVIAGLQNSLRNQTQRRIDEGFIGFRSNSQTNKFRLSDSVVGVGKFNSSRRPSAFTTSNRDFSKDIAESVNVPLSNLTEPAVFVVKKNAQTLANLIAWLTTHNASLGTETIQEPMLLVDDEADNASINIRNHLDEVSRINGQIRELMNLFDRRCYLGYTATPFANIFIDPDSDDEMRGHDLFPRDFIVSLDAPSNYFGPSQVFSQDFGCVLQDIEDNGQHLPTSHKIDHHVVKLPPSLCDAVRVFVLARAIRLEREHEHEHNSMLVNVSRFTRVQAQIRDRIQSLVDQISRHIRVNGAMPWPDASKDPELAELHRLFEVHYASNCQTSWSQIQPLLQHSIEAINVVEINSRAAGTLDYDQHESIGLNVIAVGGMSLSRGLTLEGLVVSYFLRRSLMYDTLFQMGRWFGYRDGYEDLCRVWMPEEAQGWYAHISESVEELRDELTRMQQVNATPYEFGLKVRSHPDALIVTARNKMGSGSQHTVLIGLAKQFVETAILKRDETTRKSNLRVAIRLADQMRDEGIPPETGEDTPYGKLVRDVPVNLVDMFIRSFKNHPSSIKTESDPVCNYIYIGASDELSQWDVLFASVRTETNHSLVDESLGFRLVCTRRAAGKSSDEKTLMVTNKQRVSSRGITKVGLTQDQVKTAELKHRADTQSGSPNYPDRIYTEVRKKPLLIVHLIAIGDEDSDLSTTEPVCAWSISFPATRHEEKKVEYFVKATWCQEHFGADDRDDDYEEE